MKKYPNLLPLNLQFFAEEPAQGYDNPPAAEPSEPQEPKVENKIPYDRFKEKVDEANELKRKLAEIEEERAKKEREELESQNNYKQLYDTLLADTEKLKAQAEAATLEKAKTDLLVQAGYTGEQLDRVRKYLQGTDEASLKASLDEVKADIPPKSVGVDPSAGNTPNHPPKQKDPADTGRSLYQRLKEAGKIKR
ncbi:hypothetical protein ACNA6I_01430 [Rossellomorea sp. FS2]|uniref:hypothetical protein n=1 Tax=Rossellomorea sp. FS2 TaxID=3391447 RepID=UPI003A4D446E